MGGREGQDRGALRYCNVSVLLCLEGSMALLTIGLRGREINTQVATVYGDVVPVLPDPKLKQFVTTTSAQI